MKMVITNIKKCNYDVIKNAVWRIKYSFTVSFNRKMYQVGMTIDGLIKDVSLYSKDKTYLTNLAFEGNDIPRELFYLDTYHNTDIYYDIEKYANTNNKIVLDINKRSK